MKKNTKKIFLCTTSVVISIAIISGLGLYRKMNKVALADEYVSADETLAEPSPKPASTPTQKPVTTSKPTVEPAQKPAVSSKPTVKPTEKPVLKAESIKFTKKTNKIRAGKKYTFKAKVTGKASSVKWSVTNKKYAVINKNGVFIGIRAGSVYVTAKAGSKSVKCKVKIIGKKKIAIDAGHQLHGNSSTEPVGPGSSVRKPKVAGGAAGVATGVPEYKMNLNVAKKLRSILLDRGYEVYMVRTKNNVNISNKERALKANKSGSDIYIRIHGDSSSSSIVKGASVLYPSSSNPYVKKLSKASQKLSEAIIKKYCESTGIKNRGLVARDDLTGTNWSKIPVTLIEMGFMSNPSEDRKMQNSKFQVKMARGIANGIDSYFGF